MATSNHYGTIGEAMDFFDNRLHSFAWDNATPQDRIKALNQATELVDQFDYIGDKYAVAILGDDATCDQKQTAELSQSRQFPRGDVNDVPGDIEKATYLIAYALLDGRDPEKDLETLPLKQVAFGDARSAYERNGNLLEHLTHLIPSPQAWNLIRPYLRLRNSFQIKKV